VFSSPREMSLLGRLLYTCTREEEKNIVDSVRVGHLVLRRLVWCKRLTPEQAIREVAYDYLLTTSPWEQRDRTDGRHLAKEVPRFASPKRNKNLPKFTLLELSSKRGRKRK